MSNEKMLEVLRNSGLTKVSAGYDEWIEAYKGLRTNTFDFVYSEEEFTKDLNSCIVIAKNGVINEEGLKVAYKYFILQKLCLPKIL